MGAADLNLRQTKLKFDVFDYDQWSADDPMGVTEFPLVVFDEDEQAMIRRAAKWRSKKRKEARARARGDLSPAPSPAFLPGIGGDRRDGGLRIHLAVLLANIQLRLPIPLIVLQT